KVDVQVEAWATPDVLRSLLDARIDLAVVIDRVRDPRVIEQPLFEDDMVVLVPPGHRLASRAFVEAADFNGETVIIYPPKEDSTILGVLEQAGATPGAVQLVQLTEAIIELVKAGLGIAALARWAVEPYVRSGSLRAIRFTRGGYRRQWGVAVRRDMASLPYVQHFITLLGKRAPSEARRRK